MFSLPCLTKSIQSGKNLKQSFYASFPEDKNLCVVECLQDYEACTKDVRAVIQCSPKIMHAQELLLCPQEEVLLAADCGPLELESWKHQEFLCV